MKVLFVSAVFPYPLYSGGQVRIYNILKRLSRKHEITLCSFIREDRERRYLSKLDFCKDVYTVKRGYAWQPRYIVNALVGRYSFLLSTYDLSEMNERILALFESQKFDLLHLEPFYVWPSVPQAVVPIVVSEHNIEYQVYERFVERFPIPMLRPVLSWDVGKLFRWERKVWRRACAVTAVSQTDARVMSTYLSHDVFLVPNGVDLSSFPLRQPRDRVGKNALFVGNFRWLPNRQAAETLISNIWPEIQKRYKDATLTVVGRFIPSDFKRKAAVYGVNIRENEPDISKVYRQHSVLIAPHVIAGGTKYKILEAMASGTVVVTSPQGVAGLAAEADEHYLEAFTPHEFVRQTANIWDNPTLAGGIAKRARLLIEKRYTWERIADVLDRVWKDAA